ATPVPSAPSAPISQNARCGASFGGQTCQGSKYGNCCSNHNYCGSSDDHCKIGCQASFGTCKG
ncbi:carbohydrate-binding module family 18 protein, partial [Plenodomus tracheiphilus IPT5]